MKCTPAPLGLLAATLLAASCQETPAGPTGLTGTPWRLVQLQGEDGSVLAPPRPDAFTLEFRGDGQAAVRADCNSCSGGYSLAGSTLSFDRMACTLAYCGPSLDREYLALLEGARSAETTAEGRLRIWSSGGRLDFER